jgi:hypothetical protein
MTVVGLMYDRISCNIPIMLDCAPRRYRHREKGEYAIYAASAPVDIYSSLGNAVQGFTYVSCP